MSKEVNTRTDPVPPPEPQDQPQPDLWDDIYGDDGTAAGAQERPSIDVERLAEAIANVDPAMKAYWSRDDWKGTDRKFAAEILKELARLSSLEPVEPGE
jgi:hypothetical protein